MSSLARWFLAQKWAVSGSDIAESDLIRELTREGVKFVLGHKKGLAAEADVVIRSQAILPTNPEYREAAELRIPIFTYPEIIGSLTRRYKTLAVAGAHGKSTTTAMLALAAIAGRKDPTVILGTKLKEFGGKNFRSGKSNLLVLEADEYGCAFLNYSPAALIITNIDREHLDTYSGIGDIKKTFLELVGRIEAGGMVVLNTDDANTISLRLKLEKLAEARKLRLEWYSSTQPLVRRFLKLLRVPGRHNALNAAAAYVLANRFLKIPAAIATRALAAFRGTWRRAEYKGSFKLGSVSYDVYDDYAHHPTEIIATLTAFRGKFPGAMLICVFQPHQAERLRKLFREFKSAFDAADVLMLFPEYRVLGREEKPSAFTAKALALAIQKRNPKSAVAYVDEPATFSRADVRAAYLRNGKTFRRAVVIMMGAGNIANYTKRLV